MSKGVTLVCPGCGHKANVDKAPDKVKCSICGCRAARVFRGRVSKEALRVYRAIGDISRPVETVPETCFQELVFHGDGREYKPGWAAVKFKELFNYWPKFERKGTMPWLPMQSWIEQQKSRWIATRRRLEESTPQLEPAEVQSPLMTDEDWGELR